MNTKLIMNPNPQNLFLFSIHVLRQVDNNVLYGSFYMNMIFFFLYN